MSASLTLRRRLARRRAARLRDERGIGALLEVLLAVSLIVIIGAFVAVKLTGAKPGVEVAGAVSDASRIGTESFNYYTGMNAFPTVTATLPVTSVTLGSQTYPLSQDYQLAKYDVTGSTLTVCVEHTVSGAFAEWDSDTATITSRGTTGGCTP